MIPARIVTLLALLMPVSVDASPGLLYAALFACDPVRFTNAYVSWCKSAHPDISNRFEAASAAWYDRNREVAAKSAASCEREIRSRSDSEGAAESMLGELREQQDKLFAAGAFPSRELCDSLLRSLVNGGADVEHVLR